MYFNHQKCPVSTFKTCRIDKFSKIIEAYLTFKNQSKREFNELLILFVC